MTKRVKRKHSRYRRRQKVAKSIPQTRRRHPQKKKKPKQKQSGGFKFSSLIRSLPFEMHIPGYNFCGPGTHLTKRLQRGDKGINRLDDICKTHDIAYSKARNQQDYAKADRIMINAIDKLPNRSLTEKMTRGIIATKKWLEK